MRASSLREMLSVRAVVLTVWSIGLLLTACGGDDGGAAPGPDVDEPGDITAPDTEGDADTDTDAPDPDADVSPDVDADVPPPETPEEWLLSVSETESLALPGLREPVHVVRVEGSIPHIYAANRHDLAMVQGYVVARDRFFVMDLGRRLGLGELASLLGDVALDSDLESRGSGMTHVAERILAHLTPEQEEIMDAFAAGVNAWIEAVRAGTERPPSELRIASGLLGASRPADLMEPFDRRSLAGFAAVIVYNLGYETGDVGRAANVARLATHYAGDPYEALRSAGALEDIWPQVAPIYPVPSALGWGLETEDGPATAFPQPRFMRLPIRLPSLRVPPSVRVPHEVLDRMVERNERQQRRLNRDAVSGYGSNVWGVSGTSSVAGTSLLAGDGHLQLSVPSLFYQIGFDTSILGGDDFRQVGLIFPGLPFLAVGTNGRVAWSQTQLSGDITDWYEKVIRLDEDGLPAYSLFEGEWMPLERIDEVYDIASVPVLGSTGREETWPRWQTFDGRWLAEIEGRSVAADAQTDEGESVVSMRGGFVIPGDLNGDDIVTGVSFAYAGLHVTSLLTGLEGFGTSQNVQEFREWTRYLIAYSQNIIATDHEGNAFYTSYQAVPCRGYLEREDDGSFAPGSHPALLLDGTRYGNFRIPTDETGRVDEEAGGDDPYACLVPFEAMPQALNPPRGYVQNANNDPGGASFSNSLTDEPWYIGGPWTEGYRADTIARELERAIAEGAADDAAMRRIQGNVDSRIGEDFVGFFLEAIDNALALDRAVVEPDSSLSRVADMVDAYREPMAEVRERLARWEELGFQARSGVETFYQQPSAEDVESAIATMIFNAWFGHLIQLAIGSERLPHVWQGGAALGQVRLLRQMFEGRGADNPLQMASWNPDTEESIFWDIRGTDVLETSLETTLKALVEALEFLASEPNRDVGGFGSWDMSTWLWGMRHQVRFESLLAGFLGDDPRLSLLTDEFAINARRLRLAADLPENDPRRTLTWFPRDADQFAVDAGNPGLSGTRFTYGSGPVFRMVVELGPDTVRGWNILPGGQSGLTNSDYFDDQVPVWLANDVWPMRFAIEEVVEGATGREVFMPSGP